MHSQKTKISFVLLTFTIVACGLWLHTTTHGQAMTVSEDIYTGYAVGSANNPFPAMPACPAGARTIDFSPVVRQLWDGRWDYPINALAAENRADIFIYKKEDHPERCRYGGSNDGGAGGCDDTQYNEGLRLFMNNNNIHNIRDRTAEGSVDQYVFTEIRNVPINPNSVNTFSTEKYVTRQDLEDAGYGASIDSVTRICLRPNAAGSVAPSPISSPSVAPSPVVVPSPVSSPSIAPSPVVPSPIISPSPLPSTGTILVCQILSEFDGANDTITAGSNQSGALISTRFFDGNPNLPPTGVATAVPNGTNFTLPLNLNTKLAGFPDGPGFGGYNAECRSFNNLPHAAVGKGHYYYQPTIITGGSNWLGSTYHDSYTQTPSIANMASYSNNLFDGDPSNDADSMRNTNADGDICIGACTAFYSERNLVLYTRYGSPTPPPPVSNIFQVLRGDVYSDSNDNPSIDSPVGPGESFIVNPPGIVFSRNSNNFSGGQATPLNQEDENYPTISINNRITYQNMWSKYQSDIQILNIQSKSDLQLSGIYLHQGLLGDNDLVINGSGWDSWNVQDKITVFVDGDLYINRDISVDTSGRAILTFVVSGSVGIGPDVTNVQGIIIAGDTFDTACDPDLSPGGFDGNGKCRPHDTEIVNNPQLLLEGMFIINGGTFLDRKSAVAGEPAELFSLRPDFYLSASHRLGLARYNWTELRE